MVIRSFAIRSSGRDLRAVRRATPTLAVALPEPPTKAELVTLAKARGLDTRGTKADISARLAVPESNDATVNVEPADD